MVRFFLKPALLALLIWQTETGPQCQSLDPPVASPNHLRYRRTVTTAVGSGQACAVLDGQVFAHSAPALKDLRLYRGLDKPAEIPYAITLSESLQQESEDARILDRGIRGGRIVFDLEMPHRPYTYVALELAAKDFVATATVFGEPSPGAKAQTLLGKFTLFDLTSQRLSHSTGIPLPESIFPYLHVEVALSPAPGVPSNAGALRDPAILKSATVPPSREAQTVYTPVAQTSAVTQRGRQTVATIQLPVRVPIERISFAVSPSFKGNFSREVEVKAHAVAGATRDTGAPGPASDETPRDETLAGTISRVHATEAGRELASENLSLPASLGSNMQRPALVEIDIDNGDDQPLPISGVQLEMRQRRICFDSPAGSMPLELYYGDSALEPPVYDYAKLFRPDAHPLGAQLEPEIPNARFEPRAETRSFTERHPELLWIGLLGVVCILAVTALRSAKRLR